MNIGLRIRSVFRQGLLDFKSTPRESLSIALYLIGGLWASLAIPHFGAIISSLVFVSAYQFICTSTPGQDRGLFGFIKALFQGKTWRTAPLIIFTIPSIIFIGSAQGLAFTPSDKPSLIFLGAFGLCWLTLFYLSITLQGVWFHTNKEGPVLYCADKAFKVGLKHWRYLLIFSFYAAVMFVIGILPMGLGLLFALPIYFHLLKEVANDLK